MDLVSMSNQQVSHKNGYLVKGLTNGSNGYSNGYKNGSMNGTHIELGHSEFMKIQRYQDLIGSTPLVDITSLANPKVPGVKVLGKCEFLNPGFSMKDRIVKNIFDKAEQNGLLQPGWTVVAASSGNTGAAVAMLAAMRGYKAVITTSPKCSEEKVASIKAYGAELIMSPPGLSEDHPESYMNMAKQLAKENAGWFDVNQYDNLDNPEGHFRTLGPEIWEQTVGRVTHFVAGGSTGGTITGTGKFLKAKNPNIKCVLADPMGSIFHEYFMSQKLTKPKKFLVEGVGKGSIPGCMDFGVVDDVIQVTDEQSFQTCHRLARKEGLMVGGSAGLNTWAAIQIANQLEEPGVIVTVLCDLGVKYLSKVYNDKWLEENNIIHGIK
eukprot:GFUD01022215.1.p1 GENE.GFUD01022215.1~~GFUD01022215.1.p1  ORF type:complete len:379 (-),score=110.49 GFUD01022215.1:100-1236(-)